MVNYRDDQRPIEKMGKRGLIAAGGGRVGCEGSLGCDPKSVWTAFEGRGDRMGTACAISLTRMEEGKTDGVERNRSAHWIRCKIATRVVFTSLIRVYGKSTRVEKANRSASCSAELDTQTA